MTSVLNDPRPDLELVVVDDGSSDTTGELLQKIGDTRLRVYRLESEGNANRARNAGARWSRGELIAFLDSDDLFTPKRIDRLIAYFSRHAEVDCLVDGYVEISPRGQRFHRMPKLQPNPEHLRRMLLLHLIPLTNSAVTVRRSAFAKVGGYDEAMPRHQDRELLLRLSLNHLIDFGQALDVEKHRSRYSISRTLDGYIEGLDELTARWPEYLHPENADIFRYLISRGIFKAFATGYWIAGLREIREWRKARYLPKDYWATVRAYLKGKHMRSLIRSDLR